MLENVNLKQFLDLETRVWSTEIGFNFKSWSWILFLKEDSKKDFSKYNIIFFYTVIRWDKSPPPADDFVRKGVLFPHFPFFKSHQF